MGKGITENFNEFTAATQSYIESTISYHKLDLFKKSMKAAISGSHILIMVFFLLIALLFLSVAASIYIGNALDSVALGYLIVGGFYFLLLLLSLVFLKPILERKIIRGASRSFFNNNEEIKVEQYEKL